MTYDNFILRVSDDSMSKHFVSLLNDTLPHIAGL